MVEDARVSLAQKITGHAARYSKCWEDWRAYSASALVNCFSAILAGTWI